MCAPPPVTFEPALKLPILSGQCWCALSCSSREARQMRPSGPSGITCHAARVGGWGWGAGWGLEHTDWCHQPLLPPPEDGLCMSRPSLLVTAVHMHSPLAKRGVGEHQCGAYEAYLLTDRHSCGHMVHSLTVRTLPCYGKQQQACCTAVPVMQPVYHPVPVMY
jgi:hypothetical protein